MAKKNRKKKKQDFNDGNLSENPFGALSGLSLPDASPDILATIEAGSVETEESFKPTPLTFRCEKKGRKGKTVTLLLGSETWPDEEREKLLKKLKTTLGTGAVYDPPEIVIQGDQRKRLPKLLGK